MSYAARFVRGSVVSAALAVLGLLVGSRIIVILGTVAAVGCALRAWQFSRQSDREWLVPL